MCKRGIVLTVKQVFLCDQVWFRTEKSQKETAEQYHNLPGHNYYSAQIINHLIFTPVQDTHHCCFQWYTHYACCLSFYILCILLRYCLVSGNYIYIVGIVVFLYVYVVYYCVLYIIYIVYIAVVYILYVVYCCALYNLSIVHCCVMLYYYVVYCYMTCII